MTHHRIPSVTLAALLGIGMALAPAPSRAQQAAGDPAAGQRVFNQCRACHTIDNNKRNGVGPNLHGIVGRPAASIEGFRYSQPMKDKGAAGFVWTEENLRAYIKQPKDVVPGGSMSYPGMRNEQQLNDLIAFLKTQA